MIPVLRTEKLDTMAQYDFSLVTDLTMVDCNGNYVRVI